MEFFVFVCVLGGAVLLVLVTAILGRLGKVRDELNRLSASVAWLRTRMVRAAASREEGFREMAAPSMPAFVAEPPPKHAEAAPPPAPAEPVMAETLEPAAAEA